jgi:ribosomal 50S subunit-recycling heat shock protein
MVYACLKTRSLATDAVRAKSCDGTNIKASYEVKIGEVFRFLKV